MDNIKESQNAPDILDELTDKQKQKLSSSIEQAMARKVIPHEEMKARIRKWLKN